jgi:hypothetical protein
VTSACRWRGGAAWTSALAAPSTLLRAAAHQRSRWRTALHVLRHQCRHQQRK